MRRISLLLAAVLIFLSVPTLSLAADDAGTFVSVGLRYGGTAVQQVSFTSASDINVFDSGSAELLATVPASTVIGVTSANGVMQSEGYFVASSNKITLESASPISCDGVKYRGSIILRCDGSLMTVINEVSMADYLTSVLGREMSASWPAEALKAQAVCARNYALVNGSKHSQYGFAVCATTDCQVYGGVASESSTTRAAVEATNGVVAKYNGQTVSLLYFSCDGGHTEDSENVWANEVGYLRGITDEFEDPQYAKLYNWEETLTKSEIEQKLKSAGINIGELLDIKINQLSGNGSVTSLTFVGTLGNETVAKSKTRTVLGLNSQSYVIEKKKAGQAPVAEPEADPAVEAEAPASPAEETETEEGLLDTVMEAPYYVLSDSGIEKIEMTSIYRLTADGTEKIETETETEIKTESELESKTGLSDASDAYDTYTFTGHGWGHLVGMSQWGAYSMAKKGYTYEDILKYYYTNIEIVRG